MDTFPDLGSLSDQELKDLIQQLTEEEVDISYKRRILHGKIDILRAELVNRLRKKHEGGEEVITGDDVRRLTDILAGRTEDAPPPAHRVAPSRGRRRAADRQVQADVSPAVSDVDLPPVETSGAPRGKSMTIGAVCKALQQEFPDISISKIRYLEDQKLLAPRRTQGGYRLYTPADVSRLRTILRLQRDEFLPLDRKSVV